MASFPVFAVVAFLVGLGVAQDYFITEEEKPVSYQFKYNVKDEDYGIDFGHEETREDEKTSGEYNVLLPDGRMQMVVYNVIGDEGFVAEVKYEGEANYEGAQAQQSPPRYYPAPPQYQPVSDQHDLPKYKSSPIPQYKPSPNYYPRHYYKARTYNLNSMSSDEQVPYSHSSETTTTSSAIEYEAPTTEPTFFEVEETETPAPVEAYEAPVKEAEADDVPVAETDTSTETPLEEVVPEAYNTPKADIAEVQEYDTPKLELQAPDVIRQRRFWRYRPYYRYY